MITHYGYTDGSGKYYISIDAEKCDGCAKCVEACPQKALQMQVVMIDIDEKTVAVISEEHRKKLKYTCSPCKAAGPEPCVRSCPQKAIAAAFG